MDKLPHRSTHEVSDPSSSLKAVGNSVDSLIEQTHQGNLGDFDSIIRDSRKTLLEIKRSPIIDDYTFKTIEVIDLVLEELQAKHSSMDPDVVVEVLNQLKPLFKPPSASI